MDTSRGGRLAARAALTAVGQQYELQPVSSAHGEIRWFVNLPQTLRELYSANATDKDFLVFGDERSTFRESYDQICRIAVVDRKSTRLNSSHT